MDLLLSEPRKMAPPITFHQAYRPIFQPITRGAITELETALDSEVDVNGIPMMGLQSLMLATCTRKMPAVELLIAKDADVNRPFCTDIIEPHIKGSEPHSQGERPLHGAAKFGKLLLRAGADVNAVDINGSTPLVAMFCMDTLWLVQVQCDIAEALLGAGADPRLAAKDGTIPLHMAAACGNIRAIDLLLSRAPETLNQRDHAG